jgi:hypothetical protein
MNLLLQLDWSLQRWLACLFLIVLAIAIVALSKEGGDDSP